MGTQIHDHKQGSGYEIFVQFKINLGWTCNYGGPIDVLFPSSGYQLGNGDGDLLGTDFANRVR